MNAKQVKIKRNPIGAGESVNDLTCFQALTYNGC